MSKKNTTENTPVEMASKITILEGRVATLERLVSQVSKKVTRRKKEYTDEQRTAIRTRLLAGQEEVRKKRETESKPAKKVKVVESEKLSVV
jgi:hypothetical protein